MQSHVLASTSIYRKESAIGKAKYSIRLPAKPPMLMKLPQANEDCLPATACSATSNKKKHNADCRDNSLTAWVLLAQIKSQVTARPYT